MTTLLSIIIFFLGGRAQWSGAKGNRRPDACKGTEKNMVGYDDDSNYYQSWFGNFQVVLRSKRASLHSWCLSIQLVMFLIKLLIIQPIAVSVKITWYQLGSQSIIMFTYWIREIVIKLALFLLTCCMKNQSFNGYINHALHIMISYHKCQNIWFNTILGKIWYITYDSY